MKPKFLITLLLAIGSFLACDPEPENKDCGNNPLENIEWLKKIVDNEKSTDDSSGLEIIQYYYKEQTVFFIEDCINNCADGLAVVYDCEKNKLCEFGGIAGLNTCPDFEEKATNKKILFSTRNPKIKKCEKETIIDAELFKKLKASPFEKIGINGNCLNITFNMLITQNRINDVMLVDSGNVLENNPVQRSLKFNLKENLTKPTSVSATTSFDISNLATWNDPKVILNIEGYEKSILYVRQPQCGDPNVNCVDDETVQKKELEELSKMLSEITKLAESVVCENSKNWKFTSVGNKACGGPQSYIAYSTKINEKDFLEKIKAHQQAEKQFNRKWGVISTCEVMLPPASVKCEKNKPVLVYK